MKRFSIEYSSTPICVFHYTPNGKDLNYALVQKIGDDTRVESLIDCSKYSVHDLVRLKRKNLLNSGKEVNLINIDKDSYIQKKVELLIKFNFNGGFRGILNSNIGNDVIRNTQLHSICDFDTFIIREVPKSKKEIRHFTITAFLELIKTSLPFINYIDLEGKSKFEMRRILVEYYRKKSCLYLAYAKKFMIQTKKLGWNTEFVNKYIDETFQTPLSFELLQELIPNSHTFKSYNYDFVYVPHN